MSREFINRVVELTNVERQRAGLPPLRLDGRLAAAAEKHSVDMAMRDYFDHKGEDGSSPFDRIKATGYRYSRAAENIYAGGSTPEDAVKGWMNSSGHRKNILNPEYREIGVGYYFLANDSGQVNYKHYWTQVFGTPV
ncbi:MULTISPECIES: CAP domain-containing protein [Nostocales]|uniref:SCP domain-containing protein n=3 Tax=Nostocales TaxID=1161 RepID=A0A0C1RAC4_9CYAN